MQGAEVTADLVSPLYDESLSAPSAQPNVTIQGSHKDMTNLFQFKSWRHRFEPATVLLNTNLDQHKTADVTQPKGSAADKHKFFDGSSSSESDSIDDPLHPGEAEQSLVDGLAIKESEMEQWEQSNPQMSRLYKGMTRSRGQHLAAQKDRMCTASRVQLDILNGQCYHINVDGCPVAHGNQYELSAELARSLTLGTQIAVKSQAGGLPARPALYVNTVQLDALCTPLGSLYDVAAPLMWLDFTAAHHHHIENTQALSGKVIVFELQDHRHAHPRIVHALQIIEKCFVQLAVGIIIVHHHSRSQEDLDSAARYLFGQNFGQPDHKNNMQVSDKAKNLPVLLVTSQTGKTLSNGDHVVIKKWAHSLVLAQGRVTHFEESFHDKYLSGQEAEAMHKRAGVTTSYSYHVTVDAKQRIALMPNMTIEFFHPPHGVYLKPGGIWANRIPAYHHDVRAMAARRMHEALDRFKEFHFDNTMLSGTSADPSGNTKIHGLHQPILMPPAAIRDSDAPTLQRAHAIQQPVHSEEVPPLPDKERMRTKWFSTIGSALWSSKKTLTTQADEAQFLETTQSEAEQALKKKADHFERGESMKKVRMMCLCALTLAMVLAVIIVPASVLRYKKPTSLPVEPDGVGWRPPAQPAPFPKLTSLAHLQMDVYFAELLDLNRRAVLAPSLTRRSSQHDPASVETPNVKVEQVLQKLRCAIQCLIARPRYGCRAQPNFAFAAECLLPLTREMIGHVQVSLPDAPGYQSWLQAEVSPPAPDSTSEELESYLAWLHSGGATSPPKLVGTRGMHKQTATQAQEQARSVDPQLPTRPVRVRFLVRVLSAQEASEVISILRQDDMSALVRLQLVDLGVSASTAPVFMNVTAPIFISPANSFQQELDVVLAKEVRCDGASLMPPGNGTVGPLHYDKLGLALYSVGEFLPIQCNTGFKMVDAVRNVSTYTLQVASLTDLGVTIGATIQLTNAILGANSVLSAGEYVEVTNIDSESSSMTVIKAGMGGLTATSNRLQCLSSGMFEMPPTCQACQAGYYLPTGQDKECQPCEAGKFSERIASSACLNCPQGFFSPGTSGEFGFSNRTIARSCTFCDKLGYTTTPGVSGKSYSDCNVCDKGYELLSGSCSVCRRGTYNNDIGRGSCLQCPAFSTTEIGLGKQRTASDCKCVEGYTRYAFGSATDRCNPCPARSFKDEFGDQDCTPCPALSNTTSTGSSHLHDCLCERGASRNTTAVYVGPHCQKCPPGYFKGQVGEAPCIKCAVGKFADSHQSTVCTLCLAGKYAAGAGSTKCFDCSPGSFIAKAGASACDDCSPGSYASLTGSSGCLLCPTGTYSLVTKTQTCLPCTYGTYTSELGSLECMKCALGKFAGIKQSACQVCIPGKFSPQVGMSTCLSCDAGKFQRKQSQSACSNCQPGQRSDWPRASVGCMDCAAGKYSTVLTAQCSLCENGLYQPEPGSTGCLQCPSGANTTDRGSSSVEQCECLPGRPGDFLPSVASDGTCFYGYWATGIVFDLPLSKLTTHWSQCYEQPYNVPTSIADLKCSHTSTKCDKTSIACGTGGKVLFGWRRQNSSVLTAAAMGTTYVQKKTGETVQHPILEITSKAELHNGAYWYTTPSTFGFSFNNETSLATQDIAQSNCLARMGWALDASGGYRAGCTCAAAACPDKLDLSKGEGADFYKVIFWAQ